MRIILFLVALSLSIAGAPRPQAIWRNGAPGIRPSGTEHDTTTEKSDLVAGRRVIRTGSVSNPTVTIYPAPNDRNTGAAVIVFPGGGFNILAEDLEGTEICEWLNSIGVTGVLMKYRVPFRYETTETFGPLQDAQRSVGVVRSRAAEIGIDPQRIGVLGFSAGAALSAMLSANFEHRVYPGIDAADDVSCRPDFAVLIYPGGVVRRNEPDKMHPALENLSKNAPPTFIVQTEDDPVRVENSLAYYTALKKLGVPVEMHLFAAGGHGYGLRRTDKPVTRWPELAEKWFRTIGAVRK